MKIVAVLGSPRRDANSSKLVDAAIGALSAKNPEVKKFVLNDLGIRGCQACYSCKGKTEFCVVKDDLTPALQATVEADLLILASPVYIGEITAQLKIFIDRSFAWLKPDFHANPNPSRLAPGKKLLFVLTQGQPDRAIYKTGFLDHYTSFFTHALGFSVETFVAPGLALSDIAVDNAHLLEEIRNVTASLV